MTLSGFIYNKLTTSTGLTAITTSIFPDKGEYPNIPMVVYEFISEKTGDIKLRKPVVSIKGIEDTQQDCETLNQAIYNIFDNSTKNTSTSYNGLYLMSGVIVNNLLARWDDINKIWYSVCDVQLNYWR